MRACPPWKVWACRGPWGKNRCASFWPWGRVTSSGPQPASGRRGRTWRNQHHLFEPGRSGSLRARGATAPCSSPATRGRTASATGEIEIPQRAQAARRAVAGSASMSPSRSMRSGSRGKPGAFGPISRSSILDHPLVHAARFRAAGYPRGRQFPQCPLAARFRAQIAA